MPQTVNLNVASNRDYYTQLTFRINDVPVDFTVYTVTSVISDSYTGENVGSFDITASNDGSLILQLTISQVEAFAPQIYYNYKVIATDIELLETELLNGVITILPPTIFIEKNGVDPSVVAATSQVLNAANVATNAANVAANSADIALASASIATNAAVSANSLVSQANNLVQLATNTVSQVAVNFTTYALANAAIGVSIANGVGVNVNNDSDITKNGFYVVTNNALVFTSPTLATVASQANSRYVDLDSNYIGGTLDANNKAVMLIHTRGEHEFPAGFLATVTFDDDDRISPVWVDNANQMLLALNADGKLRLQLDLDSAIRALKTVSFTPSEARAILPNSAYWAADSDLSGFVRSDLKHIRGTAYVDGRTVPIIINADYKSVAMEDTETPIEAVQGHGQSLSKGGGGHPPYWILPPAQHNALMLNIGTRDTFTGLQDPNAIYSLKPAYEVDSDNLTESQGTGLMYFLHRQQVAAQRKRKVFAFFTHGKGGQTITALDKGSDPYTNGITDATGLVRVANTQYGKETILRAWTWTHGEADRTGMDRSTYYGLFDQLVTDYAADMKLVYTSSKQPNTIYCFVDQLSAAASGGENAGQVAIAQLDLVEARSDVRMSTPKYFFQGNTYGFDGYVHMWSQGYDLIGEYHAKVWERMFIKEEDWKGFRPSSNATIANTIITIPFHVPDAPMVFDTSTLPERGNKGFVYTDSTNSVSISTVSIVDDGTGTAPGATLGIGKIEVALTGVPTGSDKKIFYAYHANGAPTDRSAAWGNLRDSDNTASYSVAGVTMWNWCVVFEKDVVSA